MLDWGTTKPQKDKKNKKKKMASMSEPVDLEAGECSDEPLTSDAAQLSNDIASTSVSMPITGVPDQQTAADATDTAISRPSEDDLLIGISTQTADKDSPEDTETISPSPLDNDNETENAIVEFTAGASQDNVTEVTLANNVLLDSPEADRMGGEVSKGAAAFVGAPGSDSSIAETTSKKTTENPIRTDNPSTSSEVSDALELFGTYTVSGNEKGNLHLNPMVATWSFAPELFKQSMAVERTSAKTGHEDAAVDSSVVPDSPSVRAKQSVKPEMAEQPVPFILKKVTFNVDNHYSTPAVSQAAAPVESTFLPPFNHRAFSRVDQTPRPTVNNHGTLLRVQTDKGIFRDVHELVLCQSSEYFRNICTHANSEKRENPTKLSWSAKSSFKGASPTYIDWLYNGSLSTAVIDVSDETKVGAVLHYLAEQYVLGAKILDVAYQNDFMDHFITIHVRTRKLGFRSVIDVVYEGTSRRSPMRQLLADMHAFILADDVGELDMMDHMPKAFVKDVLKSVLVIRPNAVDEWWSYLEGTGKMYHK